MIAIGIDPGTKTGLAVKDLQTGKFLEIKTMKIHEAFDVLLGYRMGTKPQELFVVVEDARKRQWFGKAGREKLQGAGSIKRDCVIWQDFLSDLPGCNFRFEPPKKGATKWSLNVWQKATGWTGRTSEHARDAALLIHRLNARNLKMYFPEKS